MTVMTKACLGQFGKPSTNIPLRHIAKWERARPLVLATTSIDPSIDPRPDRGQIHGWFLAKEDGRVTKANISTSTAEKGQLRIYM